MTDEDSAQAGDVPGKVPAEADATAENDGPDSDGVDAVRAALNRARAAAAARGLGPGRRQAGSGAPGSGAGRRRRVAGTRSGAGADRRDPQPFGSSISRLVQERGWSTPIAVGGVVGRWDQVVGEEVAAHCQPETFEEKVLTVRTDSTAWATQMRLLAPTILQRLSEELGPGVVDRLVVRGPSGPTWRRGPRIVHGGRGPRDTYG
ncbi:MAG TPA: DciA family protein [Actinomycetales bacterium]|nr:DciA family protein [Actinomycetales bacterium]